MRAALQSENLIWFIKGGVIQWQMTTGPKGHPEKKAR